MNDKKIIQKKKKINTKSICYLNVIKRDQLLKNTYGFEIVYMEQCAWDSLIAYAIIISSNVIISIHINIYEIKWNKYVYKLDPMWWYVHSVNWFITRKEKKIMNDAYL